MPSKRKKNKRRMRRVQAQRRVLEQHASCPPVKASPSIVVGAPGTVSKKASKTPKPAPPKVPEVVSKIPEAVPIAVPIVEAPQVIPKVEPSKEEPVVAPVEVEVVAAAPEVEVEVVTAVPELEQEVDLVAAAPEPEPEVVVPEVEIPEVPASVITEAPVVEAPPEEAAPVEEVAAPVKGEVQEVEEPIIPEAEPEIEVEVEAEAPEVAHAEIEVVAEETAVITETEQTHDVCEPVATAQTEAVASDAVEEPITEEAEECVEKTEMIEEITVEATKSEVDADIEELGSQSVEASEDSSAVQVVVDEPTESKPTEVVDAILTNAPAVEDAEADIKDEASPSPVSESVDSGPVADEPESVECEQTDEKTVAVPQEMAVTAAVECVESEPVAEEEEEEKESFPSQEEEEDCEMEVLSQEAPAETNHIQEDIPIPSKELPVEQEALPLPPLTAAPEPVTEVPVDITVDDTSAEVIELLPVFEKPTVAVCELFGPGPVKMTSEPELIIAAEDTLNEVAADKCFDVEEPRPESCHIPLDQESVTNTSINMLNGTEWMAQQQVPGLDC